MDEEEESGEMNLQQFLAMLKRRKRILLGTFATVFALGALYTLTRKPLYQATAQILVSSPSSSASSANAELLASLTGGSQARPIGTQIAILQSPNVWLNALNRLAPDEQEDIRRYGRSDIKPVPTAEVISVAITSRQPLVASRMANVLCDQYIQESLRQSRKQVEGTTSYVQSQLQPAKERLDKASLALRTFQEKNGTIDLSKESENRIAQVTNTESAQKEAEAQRLAAVAQAAQLQEQISRLSETQQASSNIGVSPAAAALKSELTQLEIKLVETRRVYTDVSRPVRDLHARIAALQEQLKNVAQTSVGSSTIAPNPIRQALEQQLATTQAQIWALEARSRALQTASQQARTALSNLPERSYGLNNLVLERAILEDTYKNLQSQYQNLRINSEANLANARILSRADAPTAPISPNKKINFILTTVLATLLALAFSGIAERLDDHVHSDDDVESATGLPILTHVPFIKQESLQALPGNLNQTSPLLESYRMLRSNIVFAGVGAPLRSLAITSSETGEGKSLCAVNLATVLAMSGKRVVVVDCDLRRPRLHALLNVSNHVGFTSIIAEEASLEEALQSTSVPNLHVLTSGPTPFNAPELLDSPRGHRVMQQIIESADYVVFDTPPALALTDAQIVASIADGVLLVVSNQESGKKQLARTNELLSHSGTRRLGVVLNKTPLHGAGYYGYYNDKPNGNGLNGGIGSAPRTLDKNGHAGQNILVSKTSAARADDGDAASA